MTDLDDISSVNQIEIREWDGYMQEISFEYGLQIDAQGAGKTAAACAGIMLATGIIKGALSFSMGASMFLSFNMMQLAKISLLISDDNKYIKQMLLEDIMSKIALP